MDLGLKHKNVLITCSTAGIGLATAAEFLAEGANVIICGRDPARLDAAMEHLTAGCDGRIVDGITTDLSDEDAVRRLAAFARARLGDLHAVVNVAPPPVLAGPIGGPLQDWDETYRAVLRATVTLYNSLFHRQESIPSAVVNVFSASARASLAPEHAVSASIYGAAARYVAYAAAYLAPRDVRINTILPMTIANERWSMRPAVDRRTREEMTPLQRLGRSEEVASLIAFLASDRCAFLTGAEMQVDGGYMVRFGLPSFAARQPARV